MLSSIAVEEEPSENALRRRERAVKWFHLRRKQGEMVELCEKCRCGQDHADVGKIVQLGLLTHFVAGIRLWT